MHLHVRVREDVPVTLREQLEADGATFTERGGVPVATQFGESAAEVRAAREGAALFDLSHRRLLEISDEDRERFLSGMVTQEIKNLAPGQGVYTLICNVKGKVLADCRVWLEAEHYLVESDPEVAPKIFETLDHYIIADYVELEDCSERYAILHLTGKKAAEVTGSLGIALPAKENTLEDVEIDGQRVRVAQVDRLGQSGIDLWCTREGAPKVWGALKDAGAHPAGESAWNLLLLENGLPRYGADFTDTNLPQEAGLFKAFSTTKGCYIGQEVICKIQSYAHVSKHLVGLQIDGELPPPGAVIQVGGKEAGTLTQAAASPTLGAAIGLGYVKHALFEGEKPPAEVEITWEGGSAKARTRVGAFVER